jgi:transposase
MHTGRVSREELAELLERFGYSTEGKRELARYLGISLATLYRWLKKYKL